MRIDVIPEDHFDSTASCLAACEDGLNECINRRTPKGTCEMSYHDCIDDCDRSTLIEEF
jgi:hypothetical protein